MSASREKSDLRYDGDDRLRAYVYGVLARLLGGPPDADTLSLLSLIDARDEGTEDDLAAQWRHLQTAAATADIDRLSEEYSALFIGVGRGELVPYASWYLTGFLMERPLVQLRGDLARLGFERQEHVREPEDHAAALCDVMALLNAGEDGVDAAATAYFFQRHIGPWMGRLFRDMQTANSADFYRAVGRFGERFMDIETRYFDTAPAASLPDAAAAGFGSMDIGHVGPAPDGE